MFTEKDKKRLGFIIQVLYWVTILGIVFFFLNFAFSWILPFLIAFGISLIVDPLIRYFTERFKWKRVIASTIIISIVLLLLIFLAGLLSTTLFREIKGIFGNLSQYLESATIFIQNIPTKYGHLFDGKFDALLSELVTIIKTYDYASLLSGSVGSGILKYAGNFLSSLPSVLVFLIVTVVSTYFTSASLPAIKEFILKQFSEKTKDIIVSVKFYFINTIVKYLRSYFVLMMITFAELSVAFLIFDFNPPITLAFVISLVDILPILGVGTVLIPWSILELILGNPIKALIIICIYIVITIVRQILEPKVIGDHVGLLPIVTLFCIYVGLKLFGVLGMFLFPITVIILKNLQETGKIHLWK